MQGHSPMVMSLGLALLIIVALASIPWAGMAWFDLGYVFGVMVPYAALSVFLAGGIHRLITWGGAPDPFKIPTTAGQQKSLNWIEHDRLENPYTVS